MAHEISVVITVTDLVTGTVREVRVPRAKDFELTTPAPELVDLDLYTRAAIPRKTRTPALRVDLQPITDPASGIAFTVTTTEGHGNG